MHKAWKIGALIGAAWAAVSCENLSSQFGVKSTGSLLEESIEAQGKKLQPYTLEIPQAKIEVPALDIDTKFVINALRASPSFSDDVVLLSSVIETKGQNLANQSLSRSDLQSPLKVAITTNLQPTDNTADHAVLISTTDEEGSAKKLALDSDQVKYSTRPTDSRVIANFLSPYPTAEYAVAKKMDDGSPPGGFKLLTSPPAVKNLLATGVATGEIKLTWQSGGNGSSGYAIAWLKGDQYPADMATGTFISSKSITATSHTLAGLNAATRYSFLVAATNEEGFTNGGEKTTSTTLSTANSSSSPNSSSSTTSTAPGIFSITAPAATATTTSPAITWSTASGASSYNLVIYDSACLTAIQTHNNLTSTSLTLSTALTNLTTYCLKLTAANSVGSTNATNTNYTFTISVPVSNVVMFLDKQGIKTVASNGANETLLIPAPNVKQSTGFGIDRVNSKLFWADSYGVKRSNFDGSGVEKMFTVSSPYRMVVDSTNSKVYYMDQTEFKIYSRNLDGSAQTLIISSFAMGLYINFGLDIDLTNNKIYWSSNESGDYQIRSANLDGTSPATVVSMGSPGSGKVGLLKLNPSANYMYYTNQQYIKRATLAGTGPANFVDAGIMTPIDGFDIDTTNGYLYFATDTALKRANLADGTGVTTLATVSSCKWVSADPVAKKVYYTTANSTNSHILRRINFDGTSAEDVHHQYMEEAAGAAFDSSNNSIYVISYGFDKLYKVNLASKQATIAISSGIDFSNNDHLALDPAGGKMYITAGNDNKIWRANLDGSGLASFVSSLSTPQAIAIDTAGNSIYWSNTGTDEIRKASLTDGSGNSLFIATAGGVGADPLRMYIDKPNDKLYYCRGGNPNHYRKMTLSDASSPTIYGSAAIDRCAFDTTNSLFFYPGSTFVNKAPMPPGTGTQISASTGESPFEILWLP